MRPLLLLVISILAGFYAYQYFTYEPPPPPPPAPAPKAEPVDFVIRTQVRLLFDEWKRRTLAVPPATKGVQAVSPVAAFSKIRERLMGAALYSTADVDDAVRRSLREIGIPEKDIDEVTAAIMSMAEEAPSGTSVKKG